MTDIGDVDQIVWEFIHFHDDSINPFFEFIKSDCINDEAIERKTQILGIILGNEPCGSVIHARQNTIKPMSHTVSFGDGWIQVLEDAAETVSITDTLDALRFSPEQAEWAAEFGPLLCGPANQPPAYLTALDGHTKLPLSPQLTEFYSYARSWTNSEALGNVIDPDDYLDHLTDPRLHLQDLLDNEFERVGALVDKQNRPLDPARCALFSLDALARAPYNRAYFVFAAPEPEIWAFENEHVHAPDLRAYLQARLST